MENLPIESSKEIAIERINNADMYFVIAVKGGKEEVHTNMNTLFYLNVVASAIRHFCVPRTLKSDN